MSTVQTHGFTSETTRTSDWAVGGSIAEAVVGLAAVVLAIIGLAGVTATYIVPVAAICVGAALAFEGGAMRHHTTGAEMGMSAGFFGGLAGILLGILALVGVVPEILMSVAVIVLSCALMVGCCDAVESNVSFASGGMHVLAGLSGLILGILALSHGSTVLALVGLLVLSCAVAFTGTASSAGLSRMFSTRWWHTRRA